jgi:anti-sigma regulatory factor (Ser/Thr protein kinase)
VTPHLAIPISEPSQVGEARRTATRLAQELGFDESTSGRAALVVTELGTNLARHASQGLLLLGRRETTGGAPWLEVVSLDHGPGMADVQKCLADGFSTGGTPGNGLGAVQRMADGFSVHSVAGNGTAIVARIGVPGRPAAPAGAYEVGGISLTAPGESRCGDAWSFRLQGQKASVMVADGLGHGPHAAEAAEAAVAVFESTGGTPRAVLERAHERMRSTRGAAVAMAELDAHEGTIVFAGAGNITGRLVSGIEDRTLLSQHGTLGVQIRKLSDVAYAWPAHALLVLHSDGITSRWSLRESAGVLRCDPTLIAAWIIREHRRGRDDATVVVIKRAQPADA